LRVCRIPILIIILNCIISQIIMGVDVLVSVVVFVSVLHRTTPSNLNYK
jgi:hypothetical protein